MCSAMDETDVRSHFGYSTSMHATLFALTRQAPYSALDAPLELPGGYTTSRRAALKSVALAGGLGSVYVLLTRAKVKGFPPAGPLQKPHTMS